MIARAFRLLDLAAPAIAALCGAMQAVESLWSHDFRMAVWSGSVALWASIVFANRRACVPVEPGEGGGT